MAGGHGHHGQTCHSQGTWCLTNASLSESTSGLFFRCLAAFCTPHPCCELSSCFLAPLHIQTGPGKLQAVAGPPLLGSVVLVEEVAVPSPTEVLEQTALPADQQHMGSADFSLSLLSPPQWIFNCHVFSFSSKNSTDIVFLHFVDRKQNFFQLVLSSSFVIS